MSILFVLSSLYYTPSSEIPIIALYFFIRRNEAPHSNEKQQKEYKQHA